MKFPQLGEIWELNNLGLFEKEWWPKQILISVKPHKDFNKYCGFIWNMSNENSYNPQAIHYTWYVFPFKPTEFRKYYSYKRTIKKIKVNAFKFQGEIFVPIMFDDPIMRHLR